MKTIREMLRFSFNALLYSLNLFDVCITVSIFKKRKELCGVFFKDTRLCPLRNFSSTAFNNFLPPCIPDLLNSPNFPKCTAHLKRLFSGDCPFLNSNNPFHLCSFTQALSGQLGKHELEYWPLVTPLLYAGHPTRC